MDVDSDSVISLYISTVGPPVTSGELDTYERLTRIQAREAAGRGDRRLRLIYGGTLLALLSGQIVAVTTFIFLMGLGLIYVEKWVTTTFVGGTLGEVSGLAYLVVRYLFAIGGGEREQ